MIGFDFVKVYPIYPEAYEITWGLKGDGLPGIYKFSVYRSPNQRDWEELIKDVVNIHDYLDEEAPSSLKTFQVYYKIKVISPIGETAESSPVFLFEKPEKRSFLIAKEIIRRGNLLFRQFNGIKLAILKRKQYGEKCTDCFNPILDQVATSVCNCCYGTNYKGGFNNPVYVYGHIEPAPNLIKETVDVAVTEQTTTQLTLMNYPLVKTGDVIVELHNNNRWYVKDWQLTEVRRYPVRQLVTVSLIERSDVIYDFEVREK